MYRQKLSRRHYALTLYSSIFALFATPSAATAQTKTWDGKYGTQLIDVTVVYFVPSDRKALVDWKDRLSYYCKRLKQFHSREFQGQSVVKLTVYPTPFVSKWTTAELRRGDANAIFFRTLQEIDERLKFGSYKGDSFPILLAFSEINHRPLDDFYRIALRDGELKFEGILNARNHFPGSSLGGARATYNAQRGVGWGLVSADGWRVPYRGSDCVIYHEGLGHTVGLPHPKPQDRSVMSLAQYHGWLSETWIDDAQKKRLGWKPVPVDTDGQTQLFSEFRARPQPPQPRPGQPSRLKLDFPQDTKLKSLRVRFQTAIDGPWIDVPQKVIGGVPEFAEVGVFDRPTPVSYRVDVDTEQGHAELWGYYQVRDEDGKTPLPLSLRSDLFKTSSLSDMTIDEPPGKEIDLLEGLDLEKCFQTGKWILNERYLQSSKGYGVRLELPYSPPDEYKITVIVEPLDEPNGLLLGLRKNDQRFAALINHTPQRDALTALENIDGKNVGNQTTFLGDLFKQNRLSQVIITVRKEGVRVTVDGRLVIDWKGSSDQLSLSDYWKTPNERSLFLGTYDCAYRFHRVTIETL